MRTNIFEFIPVEYHARIAVAVVLLTVAILILDASINRIFRFDIYEPRSFEKISLFIGVFVIFIVTQHMIIGFAKNQSRAFNIRPRLYLKIFEKTLPLVQLGLIANIAFIISQILTSSSYAIDTLILTTCLSYSFAAAVMTILSIRFFSWYQSNKNLVVLLYGLSSLTISVSMLVGIAMITLALQAQPDILTDRASFPAPFFTRMPLESFINLAFVVTSIASFLLTWAATSLLLRHQFERSNRIAYWLVMILPLGFFLLQYQAIYISLFSDIIRVDPTIVGLIFTMIFSWSKPIGGILFGIAFFVLARKTSDNFVIRRYAILSAFGYMLLFMSSQAGLFVSATYPPFGIFAVSFAAVSSYMLMVGIFSSAISMSEDSELRRLIRTSVLKEPNLVDILGIPEREDKLAQRIAKIAKNHADEASESSGVALMSDENIKEYLDSVLSEIKAMKSKQGVSGVDNKP